jgi:hypothetical protein
VSVAALTRILKLVGINVATLAGILLAMEGCVRVVHPEIGPATIDRQLLEDGIFRGSHGLSPGARGVAMGAGFEVTNDGFISYSSAQDGTRPAWLFLGDSVTMGIGVEPDSTFAGRADREVSDSMRVINPSAIGYASRDYVNVLDSLSRRTDLLIRRITVFWCLNDVYPDSVAALGPTGLRRLVPAVTGFVYRHIRSYQWLKALLTYRPRAYYEYDEAFYRESNPSLQTAVTDLQRLKTIADSLGAPLTVVALPYEYQLRTGSRVPQEVLEEALAGKDIPLVDASKALTDAPSVDFYLYGDGIHLSVPGHAAISRFILGLGRMDPTSGGARAVQS